MSFFFLPFFLEISHDSLQQEKAVLQRISVPHSGNIWRRREREMKCQFRFFLVYNTPEKQECGNKKINKNSQLAGCSPNRRINWSCVNFTKVSYCSEIHRTAFIIGISHLIIDSTMAQITHTYKVLLMIYWFCEVQTAAVRRGSAQEAPLI